MARRLALGTAQLGQRYGIANRSGQPADVEACAIVAAARQAGVDTLDTAMSYGESEQVLGSIGVDGLNVVTKLPPLPDDLPDVAGWVRGKVEESRCRLRLRRLHGLLLHKSSDATGPAGPQLCAALAALREENGVAKIGVSIYAPEELARVCDVMKLDLVQAPFNVFDRRLLRSGWLGRLRDNSVEVHVRSTFLQGLLLMSEAELPPAFARWRPLWSKWHAWTAREGLSAVQATLGFALRTASIDRAIVGVETASQLQEIVAGLCELHTDVPEEFASDDLDLIDPSRWKKS